MKIFVLLLCISQISAQYDLVNIITGFNKVADAMKAFRKRGLAIKTAVTVVAAKNGDLDRLYSYEFCDFMEKINKFLNDADEKYADVNHPLHGIPKLYINYLEAVKVVINSFASAGIPISTTLSYLQSRLFNRFIISLSISAITKDSSIPIIKVDNPIFKKIPEKFPPLPLELWDEVNIKIAAAKAVLKPITDSKSTVIDKLKEKPIDIYDDLKGFSQTLNDKPIECGSEPYSSLFYYTSIDKHKQKKGDFTEFFMEYLHEFLRGFTMAKIDQGFIEAAIYDASVAAMEEVIPAFDYLITIRK